MRATSWTGLNYRAMPVAIQPPSLLHTELLVGFSEKSVTSRESRDHRSASRARVWGAQWDSLEARSRPPVLQFYTFEAFCRLPSGARGVVGGRAARRGAAANKRKVTALMARCMSSPNTFTHKRFGPGGRALVAQEPGRLSLPSNPGTRHNMTKCRDCLACKADKRPPGGVCPSWRRQRAEHRRQSIMTCVGRGRSDVASAWNVVRP